MSAIDEVKQRIDIVDIVGQYTKLTKAGRNFRALCPFHNEKTPSFFVFPDRQSWHCFGACGTGGDAFAFVMKKEGLDFGETLRRLADRAGVILPSRPEADAKKETRERLFQANDIAAAYFHGLLTGSPAGESALAYLISRGITEDAIRLFRLGYAPNSWDGLKGHLAQRGFSEGELVEAGLLSSAENGRTYDRWRDRLMIPIRERSGRTAGFGARVLDGSLPKYINSPQTPVFDKSATLYGLDLAAPAIKQQDMAVIVEGYMDAIAAHQFGFSNVIASMGTSITEKQIGALKRLSRNVVLALDPDSAGEEAMLRCVDYENTLEAEIKIAVLPLGKDPDDVIKTDTDAWRRLVAEATPVIDYTFDTVAAKLDLTRAKDKAAAIERLLPFVADIKDVGTSVWRRHDYLQRLSRLSGVPEKELEAAVSHARSRQKVEKASRDVALESSVKVPLVGSPLEEYCLTLLLRYQELREDGCSLPPDYFENSENREVFVFWRDNGSTEILEQTADAAMAEHLERVVSRSVPPIRIREKYADCVLRLREKFLRNLEKKREAMLAQEAETGGTAAGLAKLKEQGSEVSAELGRVFALKAQREQGLRR